MMKQHLHSQHRGSTDIGWLQSRHSFSFGRYYNPAQMGFRSLRVINDDHIAPGKGFDLHPHSEMEIITVVLSGALRHKDSLGNEGVLKAGEVQQMSAGTGIVHGEFNASEDEPVHLYQIWIEPKRKGVSPSYDQKPFALAANTLTPLVSGLDAEAPLRMHQDAVLSMGRFEAGEDLQLQLSEDRGYWLQLVSGRAEAEDLNLAAGDGLAIEGEQAISLSFQEESELILFDLP